MEHRDTNQRKKKQHQHKSRSRSHKYYPQYIFPTQTPVGSYIGRPASAIDNSSHHSPESSPMRHRSEHDSHKIILRNKKLGDHELPYERFTSELVEIHLNGNKLTQLILTSPMDNLESLILYKNQISRFPICNARNLTMLDLSNNNLSQGFPPEALLQFPKLERLDLSSTKLAKLPSSIGELSALKVLWLEDNQLVELPREIIQLEHVEEFSVWKNYLKIPWQNAVDIGGFEAVSDRTQSSKDSYNKAVM
jgi:Leucine-rich repeat (LRR) protein